MSGPEVIAHVTRFLDRMANGDWDAMAACVADDVVRVGPYRDVKVGRREYRDFLASTIEALDGYRMGVQRIWSDGARAVAQLSETLDVEGRPRRTDEAVVIDVGPDGLITRVEVYLQRAYFVDEEGEIPRP